MTPQRVIRPARRHWRVVTIGVGAAVLIFAAFVAGSIAVTGRADALNDHIYEQCVRDELQDALAVAESRIIITQLRAAKRRLRALPPTSAERIYQTTVLDKGIADLEDSIAALEPPEEQTDPPCDPPEGVTP